MQVAASPVTEATRTRLAKWWWSSGYRVSDHSGRAKLGAL